MPHNYRAQARALELKLPSPVQQLLEAPGLETLVLSERSQCRENQRTATERSPCSPQLEKTQHSQQNPKANK